MRTIDRLIIGMLAAGIWVLIAIQITSHTPAYALNIDASDIDGLRGYIESTVEDCYVYGDADDGDINAYISC